MLKAEYYYDLCRDNVAPDVGKSGFEFRLEQEIFLFSYTTRGLWVPSSLLFHG